MLTVSNQKLKEDELKAWTDLPFWLPDEQYFEVDNQRMLDDFDVNIQLLPAAIKQGLPFYDEQQWYAPSVGMSSLKELNYIDQQNLLSGWAKYWFKFWWRWNKQHYCLPSEK